LQGVIVRFSILVKAGIQLKNIFGAIITGQLREFKRGVEPLFE
jgi:hypothetical protein